MNVEKFCVAKEMLVKNSFAMLFSFSSIRVAMHFFPSSQSNLLKKNQYC